MSQDHRLCEQCDKQFKKNDPHSPMVEFPEGSNRWFCSVECFRRYKYQLLMRSGTFNGA